MGAGDVRETGGQCRPPVVSVAVRGAGGSIKKQCSRLDSDLLKENLPRP